MFKISSSSLKSRTFNISRSLTNKEKLPSYRSTKLLIFFSLFAAPGRFAYKKSATFELLGTEHSTI